MMIHAFPSFSKLDLQLKENVEKMSSRFLPYSDFVFTSLFCWNTEGSTEVSNLNGNLVISLPDYLNGERIISILGDQKIEESVVALLEHIEILKLVPEATIENLQHRHKFKIEEDPDHFDYIYDLNMLSSLTGQQYSKIRNKINSFKSAGMDDIQVRNKHIHEISTAEKKELLDFFDKWAKSTKQSIEACQAERMALSRLLGIHLPLDLIFTVAKAGSSVIGFSINELLSGSYAVCHFEKALSERKNTYSFITNESAKYLVQCGVKFANWEQDMGLEGLRYTKTQYRPSTMLKKYRISLA